MSPVCRLGIIVVILGTGSAVAQNDAKKEPAKPNNEVEVKFGDSSAVRMLILQENVEIVTKFGKLVVPMSEVRKIDLGVHLAEGVSEKIDDAMKKLHSEAFKDRDAAVNELVNLGPAAYPTLHAASKSTDPEVNQRVQMALKRIKAKFPADALRTTPFDRIITKDFPIVGRIVSPTIKAQTPYFGAVDLKLPEVRSILWLADASEVELTVDATKYCHRVNWMDTGVNVEVGGGLQIAASGEVDLLPGNGNGEFISGPQGNFNVGGRGGPGNRFVPGLLLGKIGESGTIFSIGERYHGIPSQEGKLYLQIVAGNWGGNQPQGAYKVKVSSGLHVR